MIYDYSEGEDCAISVRVWKGGRDVEICAGYYCDSGEDVTVEQIDGIIKALQEAKAVAMRNIEAG